jgi:hypothetical protein
MLGIDGDAALAGIALAEHEVDEVLEVKDGLAAAADEDTEVVSAYVNHSERGPLPIAVGDGLAQTDLRVDLKDAKEVVDDASGEVNFLGIDVGFDDGLILFGAPAFARWPFRPGGTTARALAAGRGSGFRTSAAATFALAAKEVGLGERGTGGLHESIAARRAATTAATTTARAAFGALAAA